ncbi:type IV secretion system protein VirD2 [Sphingobium sp. GW456-12-10-14-TSB1]|uniref:relaxase/mobilization nuclease domain-containing protein n=1 Tax=Sphingobium sp. GW456-12-10-14-TSB1 TaxID=1987165 RepID=UPI000A3818CF|nr:type IV secretion system protein VirD2 [Sphingobium sp. GW456-12-10-14-TSB1]OUC54432.1 type IV secretion system protein VirD2 [Sphingobium sp. GW456-12-10-14-TSB1]
MSDFDSSFEARVLSELFRPRSVADPNVRGARKLMSAYGGARAGGTRARLARVVSRTPEVMVKVTCRKQGVQKLTAHFDYIGRKGKVALETRDGDILAEQIDRSELARDWSDPAYRRDKATVAAVSMVFSMPAGTGADAVLAAVGEVARSEIAHEWDYVLALHTDTPRPHVHLTVAARGDTGLRFNPRRHTLHHYRERFAEELRERGVAAEATPRRVRGVGRAGQSTALLRARERYRAGTGPAPKANGKITVAAYAQIRCQSGAPLFVARGKRAWEAVCRHYLAAAQRLAGSTDPKDRQLADEVRAFVRVGRSPTVHERTVAAMERKMKRESPERTRSPERSR